MHPVLAQDWHTPTRAYKNPCPAAEVVNAAKNPGQPPPTVRAPRHPLAETGALPGRRLPYLGCNVGGNHVEV
jgi:hypothetical protein